MRSTVMEEKNAFVSGAGNINIDMMFSGLDHLPGEGEELFADDFTLRLGGGIPAVLVHLKRLGIPVRIQTALGRDMFSAFAKEELKKEGIEPYNLTPGPSGMPLNVSAALLTPNDRTFVSYSDGLAVDEGMLQNIYQLSSGAKICVMDPRFLKIYPKLREEGTVLVFDPEWDEGFSLETYHPVLETADYFLPNRKEALKITGEETIEKAAHVLSGYFRDVIIKMDCDGCMLCRDGVTDIIPAIPEFQYQDATGAGDAFLAGFLYGLYHDAPLSDCVLYGNITGGKCITKKGCLTARCSEEELLGLAQKYRASFI